MAPFEFVRPGDLNEALGWLDDDAHLLAGGTATILLMKQGLLRPSRLVDMSRLDLRGIALWDDGSLRIGAMTTLVDIERSDIVRAHWPSLASAVAAVATVRIRAQATLGGNVVHADPAQDPPPVLVALGAHAVVVGRSGVRKIDMGEFFLDVFETSMEQDEILTEVVVPVLPEAARSGYLKYLPGTQDDYATVSVATTLELDDDGRCRAVRVVLGSVGSIPIRAVELEQALLGQALTPPLIRDAAHLVRDRLDPVDDARGSARYKRDVAVIQVERALSALAVSPTSAI